MKRFAALLGMAFCLTQGHAQHINRNRTRLSLDEFRKSVRADFESFRKKCMEDFVEFVANPWKEFKETPPVPIPKEDPVPPVVIPENDKNKLPIENKPVIIEDVVKPVPVPPQPTPVEPIEEVPVVEEKFVDFIFYGTPAKVRFDIANRPNLQKVDENGVADELIKMISEDYDNLIIDCLNLRESLHLSDWAYLQMLKKLSDKITDGSSNDSALLMAYLYMLSGYKMRLAFDENRLYMLYASKHYIYGQNSYSLDNDSYYGVEKLPSSLNICEASFPNEKDLSLLITTQQQFDYVKTPARKIVSEIYPDMNVEVSVNKNLLDFYNDYPTSKYGDDFLTRWAIYANTPIDNNVQSKLYPQLKEKLKGLSQYEAVSRLLNLVQTGFTYGYDDEVWGQDRAFFSEETLYYPYCDCEDRSILLTRLIRDLLGLKCILVYYPGHLASGVEFTDGNIKGDYIELNGHRYVIADGTYINAPVGVTMEKMDNSAAKVILLD